MNIISFKNFDLSNIQLRLILKETLIHLKKLEKTNNLTVNNLLNYLQIFNPSNNCMFLQLSKFFNYLFNIFSQYRRNII